MFDISIYKCDSYEYDEVKHIAGVWRKYEATEKGSGN